jgi:hypothetical protein
MYTYNRFVNTLAKHNFIVTIEILNSKIQILDPEINCLVHIVHKKMECSFIWTLHTKYVKAWWYM